MFIHNFKYSLKTLFRSRQLVFWTFAFPLILGTFFNMAFSGISDSEKLDLIDIAIVSDEEFRNNEVFVNAFKTLSDKNSDERLFKTKYVNEEKAKKLLEEDKIVGYLKVKDNDIKLVIMTNGIDQTIFKYVSEEVLQTFNMIKNLSEEEIKKEISLGNYNIDYERIYTKVSEMINEDSVKLNNISSSNLDYSMIEFYTLIAMTCMYGGMLSLRVINNCLANQGNIGKRVSISPTKKLSVILSSLCASYLVQAIGIALLFIYTIFVLNVDYGDNTLLVVLLGLIGSLAGLSLGLFIGTILKSGENAKTGILLAVTMTGCFLAGMFGISMKYIIDKNIPILNKINPVNMITDGLYSLYYYDTLNRYILNIISLLIFTIVLVVLSSIGLRRQKYDSI